jgi:hypothetical protein
MDDLKIRNKFCQVGVSFARQQAPVIYMFFAPREPIFTPWEHNIVIHSGTLG